MTVIDLMARKRAMEAPTLPDTSHETIQRYVMDKLVSDTRGVLYSEGQWWRVGDLGAWVHMPDDAIWTEVQALNGLDTLEGASDKKGGKPIRVTAGLCESVVALARARFVNPDAFLGSARGFVTPAGLWTHSETDGWQVRKAEPDDRVRFFVTVDPDMGATPVLWLAALARTWSTPLDEAASDEDRQDAADDLAARIAFIHEWIAVVLLGEATQHQVAPLLVGDGENGKSTILEVIASMVPRALRCSVPPHELEANQFAAASLAGKALNWVADIPATELLASAKIKLVIDGSEQEVERKHQHKFLLRPVAGNIFSANALPRSRDTSHGFWRRWMPLTSPSPPLGASEKRRAYHQTIIAAELPAIIGLAMRYHDQRASEGRQLTKPPSSVAEIQRWRGESDNVQQWIEDACDTGYEGRPAGPTAFSALYSDYKRWCGDNGCQALASKGFGNRLTALGYPAARSASAKTRPITIRLRA